MKSYRITLTVEVEHPDALIAFARKTFSGGPATRAELSPDDADLMTAEDVSTINDALSEMIVIREDCPGCEITKMEFLEEETE
jgi:hypothetical protein